jgi:hypothetical protein
MNMATDTVETNEGTLPSSTNTEHVAVTNVAPTGVDVGTNAVELQNDPNPSLAVDDDTPASAVVRNEGVQQVDVSAIYGARREIQGDYITDFMPENDGATSPIDDEAASGASNNFPPSASESVGEEYTGTRETPTNDFQGVQADVIPAGEEALKKPRRFSRT